MIRLLIVDDHDFVRTQITGIFRTVDDIEVVGECSSGEQVVGAAARVHPDVVLMDVQLGAMSGIAVTRELLTIDPTIRVLMLTGSRSRTAQEESRNAGASGFLLKDGAAAGLVAAVHAIGNNGTCWLPTPVLNSGTRSRLHTG